MQDGFEYLGCQAASLGLSTDITNDLVQRLAGPSYVLQPLAEK
jgi:hypothetical protein